MKAARLIFCALVIICIAIPAVSAFDVESVTTSPSSGDLVPGQTVTVEAMLRFSASGDYTFPASDTLKFQTELDSQTAQWKYYIILNDVMPDQPTVKGGSIMYLDGFELQYPSENLLEIRVVVEGKAPEVTETTEKTILKIQQLDASDNPRTADQYNYQLTRKVINPEQVEKTIEVREEELDELKTQIDEKSAMGVDVTAVMEKYNAAKEAIKNAKTSSSSQAFSYLTEAKTAIDEAEVLLDKAWAQHEIDRAQAVLTDVDANINFFVENRSMGSDARVVNIITKRESAGQYLTSARDYFNQEYYSQARVKADEAYQKGMEAYNASVELRNEVGEGFLPVVDGLLLIVVIIIVGTFAAVGVLLWRRRSRWDELG